MIRVGRSFVARNPRLPVKAKEGSKSQPHEFTTGLHALGRARILSGPMPDMTLPSAPQMRTTIGRMPAWLAYSLITIVLWGAWGAVSKVASSDVDANTNQVLFTLGLLPLIVWMWRSPRLGGGSGRRAGIAWAFLTGILGGTGNMAFFHALVTGGKVSIVAPATALFPLVTIILATTLLRERLSIQQKYGFGLALVAIYLLSM